MPRDLVILGSTGSIGTQTLAVVRALAGRFRIRGLAARSNSALLAAQIAEFDVPFAASPDPAIAAAGARRVSMTDLVELPDVDLVVVATPGTSALRPTLRAIELGRTVATANKEVLVAAGPIVVAAAARHRATLLPIDSEHNAIWQCLRGEDGDGIRAGATVQRIILTASGGAFRDRPIEQLAAVRSKDALQHPVWRMGSKVTIDSATLANKAFEVIEARWLFDVPYEHIDVVLHRESVIHSIVQFLDGSSKAQLGLPDMRVPIQYALTFPDRCVSPVAALDLAQVGSLTFAPVDPQRYPAYNHILMAARAGGTYPAVISAANDVAVEQFLGERIAYPAIPGVLAAVLEAHQPAHGDDLDAVLAAEAWAQRFAYEWLAGAQHTG